MEDRIVLRICQASSERGVLIEPGPARHVARTVLHRHVRAPDGFTELELSEEEGVVQAATEILCMSSFHTETLKLHGQFLSLEADHVDNRRTQAVRHEAKSMQLISNVCSRDSATDVYGEMVLYIVHGCGLFDQSSPALYRETMLALESALPRATVPTFMSQSLDERHAQLTELWRIIWGLRIYMAATGKPQVGVPDFLVESEACTSQLQSEVATLCDRVLSAAMHRDSVSAWLTERAARDGSDAVGEGGAGGDAVVGPVADDATLQECVGECVFAAALGECAQQLMGRVEALGERRAVGAARYQAAMQAVHSAVGGPDVPSKSEVFPLFVQLASAAVELREVVEEASHLATLLGVLQRVEQSAVVSVVSPSIASEAAASAQRDAEAAACEPVAPSYPFQSPQAEWLSSVPPGESLAYNGYCPWAASKFGTSVKARPRYGVLAVHVAVDDAAVTTDAALPRVVYVGVSCEAARSDVARAASEYHPVAIASKVGSTLVPLLELSSHLPRGIVQAGLARNGGAGAPRTREAGTQTGQIDPYWDYSYRWNEAEIRRLAAKALALKNCKSRSAQTHASAYRVDNSAQTVNKRDTEQQTAKDAATQPPHHVRIVVGVGTLSRQAMYVKGLRGSQSSRLETVRFTFEPK